MEPNAAAEHLQVVRTLRTCSNRRPLTTVSLTPTGRQAFANDVALLEHIVHQTKPR